VDADKVGERPFPAKSVTGLMGELPHDGSVTVWLCPSILWPRIFTFSLANADEEVSGAQRILVAPNWLGKVRRHQQCGRQYGRVELEIAARACLSHFNGGKKFTHIS
jgi:hypothetical protein